MHLIGFLKNKETNKKHTIPLERFVGTEVNHEHLSTHKAASWSGEGHFLILWQMEQTHYKSAFHCNFKNEAQRDVGASERGNH